MLRNKLARICSLVSERGFALLFPLGAPRARTGFLIPYSAPMGPPLGTPYSESHKQIAEGIPNNKNEKGFTLVEVLVSMVIFMIAVVPCISVLIKVTSYVRSDELFIGSSLMKLEEEKALVSGTIPIGDTVYTLCDVKWNVQRSKVYGKPSRMDIKVVKGEREVCSSLFLVAADTIGPVVEKKVP